MVIRYSRWDGLQAPFGLDADDLMEQLKQRRRENLDRHNMSSILDDIKERLENVLKTEREGIEQRVQEGQEKVEASKSSQPNESGDSGESVDPEQQAAFQKMLE